MYVEDAREKIKDTGPLCWTCAKRKKMKEKKWGLLGLEQIEKGSKMSLAKMGLRFGLGPNNIDWNKDNNK